MKAKIVSIALIAMLSAVIHAGSTIKLPSPYRTTRTVGNKKYTKAEELRKPLEITRKGAVITLVNQRRKRATSTDNSDITQTSISLADGQQLVKVINESIGAQRYKVITAAKEVMSLFKSTDGDVGLFFVPKSKEEKKKSKFVLEVAGCQYNLKKSYLVQVARAFKKELK